MTDRLLQAIADEARAAVLTRHKPNSCIATTRVAIETAAYFGVSLRPWAVNVRAFTPEGWRLAQAGVPPEDWPQHAHSIGIIAGAGPADVGHVAAVTTRGQVTAAGDWLIDASLDQAARPARGLGPFTPVVAPLPAGLDLAETGVHQVEYEIDGGPVFYTASGSRLYLSSPNWRPGPAIRACVAEAIRAIRTRMSEAGGTMTADVREPGQPRPRTQGQQAAVRR